MSNGGADPYAGWPSGGPPSPEGMYHPARCVASAICFVPPACSVGILLGEGGFGRLADAERLVVDDGDGEIDAL